MSIKSEVIGGNLVINLSFNIMQFQYLGYCYLVKLKLPVNEKVILRFIIIVFSLLISLLAHAADLKFDKIGGKWTVQEVIDFSPIAGLDDSELTKIVGQELNISSEKITFQTRICKTPSISLAHKNSRGFFRRYRIKAPKDWDAQVDYLDIRCTSADTIGPFLLNGQEMLFVWYGALLHARKY